MARTSKLSLAKKIVEQAKAELNKEREEKYMTRAKELLEEIHQAKRTVELLEKQLKNFIREIDLNN